MNKTFHVTRDKYARMKDITDIITQLTGFKFKQFEIAEFVPEVVRRCKTTDLLFPLLDFLVRSVDNISAMEYKLYNNDNYVRAKDESQYALQDPSLEDTVKGMLKMMIKKDIIKARLLEASKCLS